MNNPIHLDQVKPAGDSPQRLNLFAGRHLGERDFDLLQAYADDRLAPFLTHLSPGIVAGLEAGLEYDPAVPGAKGRHRLHVRPGNAIGGDGRPLRLHYRLDMTWPELVAYVKQEHDLKEADRLPDGLYFLHLDRAVELADADNAESACRRAEADPLRDRRLETVSLLGLRLITGDASLLALPPARAANRLCARFLTESPFDTIDGGVPLALLKIAADAPVWFDPLAGRFAASADAPYRTFLAHSQSVLEQFSRDLATTGKPPDAKIPLAQQLGLDYLPAAGPLPAELLSIEAIIEPGGEKPGLAFAPQDLQVDLIPVPAATVPAVVARELPRGWVDLAQGRGDRVRLLLAVDDPDYRPNLLDLPRPEEALESELLERSKTAIQAWNDWKSQWLALYQGLSDQQKKDLAAPALPTRGGVSSEGDFIGGLTARAGMGEIVKQREDALKGAALPHPYSDWKASPRPPGFQNAELISGGPDGLYKQRADLETEIDQLEGELEENFALINLLNDFLGLQRQHLDAITVSFSSLAGGVPGDGSGMNLMRWAKYADFQPTLTTLKKP